MHSALFVAKIPPLDEEWEGFLGRVKNKTKDADSLVRLGENIWIVDLTKSPTPLGYLISFAQEMRISYGILPFERAPQWLPADFDPRPS